MAHRWGHLLAPMGRPLPVIDTLLAAAALAHGLVLITRAESGAPAPKAIRLATTRWRRFQPIERKAPIGIDQALTSPARNGLEAT